MDVFLTKLILILIAITITIIAINTNMMLNKKYPLMIYLMKMKFVIPT